MDALLGILVPIVQAPPVLAAVNYIVIEIIKRLWERHVFNIPNKLMPIISIALGTGFGTIVHDPLLGTVVGAASVAIENIINPKPDKKIPAGT